jgi:hypothetical protein
MNAKTSLIIVAEWPDSERSFTMDVHDIADLNFIKRCERAKVHCE